MNRIDLPFEQGKLLIKEGDILLFRGQGWISKIIGGMTSSNYTHVGLASWINGNDNDPILECIQIREFKGGIAVNLKVITDRYNCQVDVYRAVPYFSTLRLNSESHNIEATRKQFNGKAVTHTFRRLLGHPYNYKFIWHIFKYKMFGLRLFMPKDRIMRENDENSQIPYHICSSGVAYAFSKNNYDLVHNKGDSFSSPGDIARSTRLNYLFTICNEENSK